MLYDAVVVGGGPAGASTAYHLSKSGLRVLIVEKEKLPRFKLCA
ncbi:MAG: FAD-dependent oxidoreductase, partial [Aquificaceae bacterium]